MIPFVPHSLTLVEHMHHYMTDRFSGDGIGGWKSFSLRFWKYSPLVSISSVEIHFFLSFILFDIGIRVLSPLPPQKLLINVLKYHDDVPWCRSFLFVSSTNRTFIIWKFMSFTSRKVSCFISLIISFHFVCFFFVVVVQHSGSIFFKFSLCFKFSW